ncbi:SAM-dependent methyltransferase, partial [bacterium M00.F.Ca.ET.228.01.1.1]
QKRLYQGVPVAQRASRRVFVPVFSPQGATRLGRRAADAAPGQVTRS